MRSPVLKMENEQFHELQRQLQEIKEQNERLRERAERAEEGREQAGERAERAEKRVQNTNLQEFLDAVHVHLSTSIRVELDPTLTTKGDIPEPKGKVCPNFIRKWENFDQCQRDVWKKVVSTGDAFSSARTFKSVHYFEQQGPDVRKKKIASEKSLEYFERFTLETHVESLLEHLNACDSMADKFGLRGGIVFEDHQNTLSDNYDETKQRLDEKIPTTPVKQSGTSQVKRFRPGGSSYPDAFCVYRRDDQKQVPLIAVELKPPHKLPIPILETGLRDMKPMEDVVNRATEPLKKEDPAGYFEFRADRLVAAAIVQTFSYMIEHGLEYGYLGTGEAYVFLRVREDDPGTVYYHLSRPNDDVGEETGWQPDSSDENRLHLTAVAQVSAFCLQAVKKTPRSQEWQEIARKTLPTWEVDYNAILMEIPETDRKELYQSPYVPSIKKFKQAASGETPEVFRSKRPDRKSSKSCAPGTDKFQLRSRPDSSDSEDGSDEDDNGGPGPQPTPSKAHRPPSARVADNKNKKVGQERSYGQERPYCTQKCLLGILDQAELDDQCPNVLDHAQEGTHGHHNLDSQDFLWLIQDQLFKDRDTDCEPWWVQGARGAMFKVTLTSHGYTVAAKATVFAFVTDLKHEAGVYECLRKLQGTYVPVCLGGVDLLKPYYYRGVELIHMMFMAWGGRSLGRCGPSLGLIGEDVSQMAAEGVEAMHALGVLHRDLALRNMLWNEECGRVMFVDFERSVVFETKQKQRQPLGVISGNRKRKITVHITEDEKCEGRIQGGDKTVVEGGKHVLLKNRFDKTRDYNHPGAFENEVYYCKRAAVGWAT